MEFLELCELFCITEKSGDHLSFIGIDLLRVGPRGCFMLMSRFVTLRHPLKASQDEEPFSLTALLLSCHSNLFFSIDKPGATS